MAFSFSVLGNSLSLEWKIKLADRCRWYGNTATATVSAHHFERVSAFVRWLSIKFISARPFNTANKCWLELVYQYCLVWFGSVRMASFRLALFANYIHSNCLLCLCVTIYLIDFLPNGRFCLCGPCIQFYYVYLVLHPGGTALLLLLTMLGLLIYIFFFKCVLGLILLLLMLMLLLLLLSAAIVSFHRICYSTLSMARVNYGQEYIKSPFIVHETHIKTHYIEYHIWRHGKIIQMHTRLSVSHSNDARV